MKARRAYLWHLLSASFWFTPTAMLLGALGLSVLTLSLDRVVLGDWFENASWIYKVGPEGARLFLSTVAGSMITVTSLVYSMTLVAFTLASRQLGPRVVTNFMEDRVNQVVLGVFISTFVFALMLLRSVNEGGGTVFVPHGSLIVTLVLAVLCFGLLIYFVHHVAQLIQADTTLALVSEGLDRTIDAIFAAKDPDAGPDGEPDASCPDLPEDMWHVATQKSGYVQAVDRAALLELAVERDLAIYLTCRAGHFLIDGQPIGRIAPTRHGEQSDIAEAVRVAVVLGDKRTPTQDVEYGLRAIVDIAGRALSPGINDFHTAMAGIDRIGQAVARVMARQAFDPLCRDDLGRVRVVLYDLPFARVVGTAFDQVWQAARGNSAVTIHLIATLTSLASLARHEAHRQPIRALADEIRDWCTHGLDQAADRDRIEARLRPLHAALAV